MSALTPGVYSPADVPMERYVLDDLCEQPTLSNSVAALLVSRTPAHAREAHPRLSPAYEVASKDAFDLGSACHDWLLGDGATVAWIDAKDWRTKDAKAAREVARYDGMVPMLAKHRERVEAVCRQANAQIMALPFARQWSASVSELTVISAIDGVLCRGRPDRGIHTGDITFHYKTTEANAAAFEPIYTRMQYDFTAAWYRRLCGGRQIFLVQEMQAPFLLVAYEPTEESMALADRKVQFALALWRRCMERDHWPGYPPVIQPIEPRSWNEEQWVTRELDGETSPEAIEAYLDACKEGMAA